MAIYNAERLQGVKKTILYHIDFILSYDICNCFATNCSFNRRKVELLCKTEWCIGGVLIDCISKFNLKNKLNYNKLFSISDIFGQKAIVPIIEQLNMHNQTNFYLAARPFVRFIFKMRTP